MIQFSADLEINVPQIDQQHRELFSRINRVIALGAKSVSKEETDKTLKLLSDYVVMHFRDEEALQRQSNFPKMEWHKEQHRLYIENLNKIKQEYEKNGPSVQFTLQLNKSIIDWIVKHIRSADTELGKFLNSQNRP